MIPQNGTLLDGPKLSCLKIKPYPIARSASKQHFALLEGMAPYARTRSAGRYGALLKGKLSLVARNMWNSLPRQKTLPGNGFTVRS